MDSLPSPLSFPRFTSIPDRASSPGLSEAMNPGQPHSAAPVPLLEHLKSVGFPSKSHVKVQFPKSEILSEAAQLPSTPCRMEPFHSDVWHQSSFQRLCVPEGHRFGRARALLSTTGSHAAVMTALIVLTVRRAAAPPQRGTTAGTGRRCCLLPSPMSSLIGSSSSLTNTAPEVFLLFSWKYRWLQPRPVGKKKSLGSGRHFPLLSSAMEPWPWGEVPLPSISLSKGR